MSHCIHQELHLRRNMSIVLSVMRSIFSEYMLDHSLKINGLNIFGLNIFWCIQWLMHTKSAVLINRFLRCYWELTWIEFPLKQKIHWYNYILPKTWYTCLPFSASVYKVHLNHITLYAPMSVSSNTLNACRNCYIAHIQCLELLITNDLALLVSGRIYTMQIHYALECLLLHAFVLIYNIFTEILRVLQWKCKANSSRKYRYAKCKFCKLCLTAKMSTAA